MSISSALLPLTLLALAVPGFGTQVESIAINTSSLTAGTSGYLDFLYNGGLASPAATATIGGFSTNGQLVPASILETNSTGQLPSSVAITNNNAEYLEGITFGTSISFQLALSEPAYNSTFSLSLLNSTLDGSYLTSNENDGYLFTFAIDAQGHVTPTTYTTETGAPSVVSITPATVSAPEPATVAVCGIALVALLSARKSRLLMAILQPK